MKKRISPILYLIVLLLLLCLPVINSQQVSSLSTVPSFAVLISILFGGLAWIGVMIALIGLLPRNIAALIFIPVIVFVILLRFTYQGLIEFSGAGFTQEFFIHLQWHSVVLAWQEYPWIIISGVIATILLLAWSLGAIKNLPSPKKKSISALLLLGSLIFISNSYSYMPERQFYHAVKRWYQPIVNLSTARLAAWQEYPAVETDLTPKSRLAAQPPEKPLNVIILFMESVGFPLLDHPDYPGLLPNLQRLARKHSLVEDYVTSGYVTIEGMVNSLCGTLFPFERGSDALASSEGMAEKMACLPDILSLAGYQQHYLGGAALDFARKGDFLLAHGFDIARGAEYWNTISLYPRPDTFGVSDVDLFNISHEEITTLRTSGKPFNLTLLTIGTHTPGYAYEECKPYPDVDDRYLHALHCTDQLIHQWLEKLRADKQLEDTVVVITADHHIFSSPDMVGLFGRETADNRKLPFIVLSPEPVKTTQKKGSAYDLAPTVLDLLKINHNAKFILGRSLLQDTQERNYFFKRYADVYDGQRISHGECHNTQETELTTPLNPCQRQELSQLLNTLARGMSNSYAQLDCRNPEHMAIGLNQDNQLYINIDGKDQISQFVWHGWSIAPETSGIYFITFDNHGAVKHRIFYPDDSIPASPEEHLNGSNWVAVWNGKKPDTLPDWLQPQQPSGEFFIWINTEQTGMNYLYREDYSNSWSPDTEICQKLTGS